MDDLDIEIFTPPLLNAPSHLVSDVAYWKNQFKALSNANYEFSRELKKVIKHNNSYLSEKNLLRTTYSVDEELFVGNVNTLNEVLDDKAELHRLHAVTFYELENKCKRYDSYKNVISELDRNYNSAREKLDVIAKSVTEHMTAYHKAMFRKEKFEIRAKLATNPSVVYEARKAADDLEDKAVDLLLRYNKRLDKWHDKAAVLLKMSHEYREAYLTREETRIQIVLHILENGAALFTAGAPRELSFMDIDGRAILQGAVVKHESICVPKFQDYVCPIDADEMYARARQELQTREINDILSPRVTPIQTNKEATVEANATVEEDMNTKIAANKQLKLERDVYIVTTSYEKQQVGELDLNIGEQVTQLLPANEDGMAYGKVAHGIFKRKRLGFYPESCVTLEDDFRKNEDGRHSNTLEMAGDGATKKKKKLLGKPGVTGLFNTLFGRGDRTEVTLLQLVDEEKNNSKNVTAIRKTVTDLDPNDGAFSSQHVCTKALSATNEDPSVIFSSVEDVECEDFTYMRTMTGSDRFRNSGTDYRKNADNATLRASKSQKNASSCATNKADRCQSVLPGAICDT